MITAIAIAGLVFAGLCGSYRIAVGPSDGDRVAAADLLTFSFIGLIAVIGLRVGSLGSLDLVILATLVAFLAAVSLARALTRGAR
ncbi:multicomponent Na+:H+ antiporter subunit F [Kineosphaera limosa]|uniref:Na(+)/H(+) antiporter subunit F n=1 Tax=Kineosphaera limosa NBRC 100340 TaxID=1184609 RepID=K6VPF2_9MICO|nr:monovalent cation/H+ antiporter complex subunit F [Kineosphaera limosa]NYE00433.1 multicomponent Na+:H+ antiporter subunit F [Kineosphaera limosa]GAB98098.1 Na(+)/H(+) antiporter subunit F [Kineosphaera limosa NBRC 100340]